MTDSIIVGLVALAMVVGGAWLAVTMVQAEHEVLGFITGVVALSTSITLRARASK